MLVHFWLVQHSIFVIFVMVAAFILYYHLCEFHYLSGFQETMNSWNFIKKKENENVYKYTISKGNETVSFKQAIHLMHESEEFRKEFIKEISENPFEAYFFETPPVNLETFSEKDFEFVLVNSRSLRNIDADSYAFREHFKKSDCVVTSFPNLGRDAILIVPCPMETNSAHYAHLATFVRHGSSLQVQELWKRAAAELENRIISQNEKQTWFSTSGRGISWLHVRVDSIPKYYTYAPYKTVSN